MPGKGIPEHHNLLGRLGEGIIPNSGLSYPLGN